MSSIKMLHSIYVINLDDNKDRLSLVQKSFDEFGLQFTRFSAVYGKNLSEKEIEEKTTQMCSKLLCTKGMIGCALSHISLWRQLLTDNVDYYIIMEDDAKLTPQFIPTVLEIEKSNLDFDMLSLRCMSDINCEHTELVKMLSNGVRVGRSLFPLTTVSYIISRKGAEKLVPMFEKVAYHIDVDLAIKQYKDNINILTVAPNVVELSSESETSTLHEHKIKSPTLNLLNRVNGKLYWYSSIPVMCLRMKFIINPFFVFLLVLLAVNYFYIKSKIIYAYIFIELFIYIFL